MGEVTVERTDGVVRIVLDNPALKNALTPEMFAGLRDACRVVGADPDVRVVVVTGAGNDFCSGAAIAEVDPDQPRRPAIVSMRMIGEATLALHGIPQPVVARVDGVATGAGMNLALAADIIVASDRSRFCQIFARRGLSVDFGGSWILPRLVGLHRAKELVLLADMVSAADAERMGFVNRVVAADAVDETVDGIVAQLAAGPPIALSLSKRLLNAGLDSSLAQAVEAEGAAQGVNFPLKDTVEAMKAFVEKRPPVFRGL